MNVGRFGRYLTRTAHDHETGSAGGLEVRGLGWLETSTADVAEPVRGLGLARDFDGGRCWAGAAVRALLRHLPHWHHRHRRIRCECPIHAAGTTWLGHSRRIRGPGRGPGAGGWAGGRAGRVKYSIIV